jgi:hypothetical protein
MDFAPSIVTQFLGLTEGDAHCIRNAGGRFHDAHRSLIISQTLLGTDEVIFVYVFCQMHVRVQLFEFLR